LINAISPLQQLVDELIELDALRLGTLGDIALRRGERR
jgi:hypothetical protein